MKKPGDFSTESRLVWISLLAIVIGSLCSLVAVALLWLIALFTNLFYFGRLSLELTSPAVNTLGYWAIGVPAIGGLVVGLMARFGSERIRGHGIPEAMEAILIGQSRMQPKVAVLKPLSSAISIGSGGPFGAEGPIIMTGGAVGSIVAQAFHLTNAERKTLLVAGAVGGMTAIFATPLAAVLLGVELLLFEWKPRSLIPIALACITAGMIRPFLLGAGPIFPVTPHAESSLTALLCAPLVGLVIGVVPLALTVSVYAAEDAFHRLPIHWMWWPVLGGLAVGIGGVIEPKALGIGYDVIEQLIQGKYVVGTLPLLAIVKMLIWAIALGSGTSGGVLAPLLLMGGTVGGIVSGVLPGGDAALWPLVGMAAVLGGAMRVPLTGAVFALELTNDVRALPALLAASVVAHAFTVLVMKRSILTEKVARRGFHVTREYSIDPLERLPIGEVMSQDVVTVPASLPAHELLQTYFVGHGPRCHQGYPVVDAQGELCGVVTKSNLLAHWWTGTEGSSHGGNGHASPIITYDLLARAPITATPQETCATAAERMADASIGRLLIVAPDNPKRLLGILTRSDLLKAHGRMFDDERKRERFFGLPKMRAATDQASSLTGRE